MYKISFKGIGSDYTEEINADEYYVQDNLITFLKNGMLVKIYSIYNLLNVIPK